jgi:hypothetical protein
MTLSHCGKLFDGLWAMTHTNGAEVPQALGTSEST